MGKNVLVSIQWRISNRNILIFLQKLGQFTNFQEKYVNCPELIKSSQVLFLNKILLF